MSTQSPATEPSITEPTLLMHPGEMRRAVLAARAAGKRVGLVPTMGALHDGHLSLVAASVAQCDVTAVTIFVNPTQFGAGEDFDHYPRDLGGDVRKLAALGAELVFAPATDVVYPAGHATRVEMGPLAGTLEGRFRPGHFAGVATIVLKLFHLVPADVAFFGLKDFQQLLVIRQMVRDLNLPIEIEGCPIIRDQDGLALSSRNAYLSSVERQQALALSQSLQLAEQLVRDGQRSAVEIIRQMRERILDAGDLRIDYVALADPETLQPIEQIDRPVVALLAVRVGGTRLIDNRVIQA